MFKLLAVVKHSKELGIMPNYLVTELIYNSARVNTNFKLLAVVKHSEELVENAKLYR
jgi:hypothetical protein